MNDYSKRFKADGIRAVPGKEEETMPDIIVKGLTQNNLKNISFTIPKGKITVFAGVSGSGKSSIVFDTLAAEAQRQMNATYPAYVQGRLPKFRKPHAELIDNLTASVIVDQAPLGGNARSTVGTISDLYSGLRLLFSRIGIPGAGISSCFSFNDPSGMCKTCSGLGKIAEIDMENLLEPEKSWNEGIRIGIDRVESEGHFLNDESRKTDI